MTLEQRLYNGDQARLVLENDEFQKAFAAVKQEYIEQWLELPSTDQNAKQRDRLHLAVTLLDKVKATLESTLASGKLAMLELNHKRSVAERARDAKSAFFSE